MRYANGALPAMLALTACALSAHAQSPPLNTPRVRIPIPARVLDVVPTPLVSSQYSDLSDVRFPRTRVFEAKETATATAPAELTYFHVEFGARDVQSATSPRPITGDDARPILDAIVAQGLARSTIRVTTREDAFQPPWQSARPGWVDIAFTVDHWDGAQLRRLGEVIQKASGYPTYHVFSDAIPAIKNCDRIFWAARSSAFANARKLASEQAAELHVHLGSLLAVRELFVSVTQGQCDLEGPHGPPQLVYRNGEPSDPGMVVVTAQLSLTYSAY